MYSIIFRIILQRFTRIQELHSEWFKQIKQKVDSRSRPMTEHQNCSSLQVKQPSTKIDFSNQKELMVTANLTQKQRNYSFLSRNEDAFDAVEDESGTYVIPAQPGSSYWAIIKVGYLSRDVGIHIDEFVDRVADLLSERNPQKWEDFKNKKIVKTVKNGEVIERQANDWRKRIETNIKTLTRDGGSNQYGQRLIERGHILRWEPRYFGDKGAFVLRTTTNLPTHIKRGRTRKSPREGIEISLP
jgi:hypothetical protein